jgi:hypothetical protein
MYVQYHFTQQRYAKTRGGPKHGTSSPSEGKEDKANSKRKRQEGKESHAR